MENAETFMRVYQQLDEHLRRTIGHPDASFTHRLTLLAQQHRVLERTVAKLKDYGKLRNALEHHRALGGGWIAEPTERAVAEFEQLVQALLSPEKLIPRFQGPPIHLFSLQDPLVRALTHMREHDYSQVVVQPEGRLSLLTVEGIARWVEEQAREDIISVQEAVIADAWRYEQAEHVVVMSRNQMVYEAREAFMCAIEQGKPRLYALLITEHGKATEKPLGIVTPWDLLSNADL